MHVFGSLANGHPQIRWENCNSSGSQVVPFGFVYPSQPAGSCFPHPALKPRHSLADFEGTGGTETRIYGMYISNDVNMHVRLPTYLHTHTRARARVQRTQIHKILILSDVSL